MPIAHSIEVKQAVLHSARQYWKLSKAPVVILMLVTALVGALLATEFSPDILTLSTALIGIGLLAAAGAAFNHAIDMQRDQKMKRTKNRPLVTQAMNKLQVLKFACLLMVAGFWLLFWFNNALSAVLSLLAMTGYALVYSQWLKPRTPQNITIGGLAGALPPLLGWVAMTGEISAYAWLLVLIIFVWTPPHFWALAYYRQQDYKAAGVPMLCVTHGKRFTSLQLLLYTCLLAVVTMLPYLVGYTQHFFLVSVLILNARFLQLAIQLHQQQTDRLAQKTFRYSIHYLLLLFAIILLEPFLLAWDFF